MTDRQRARRIFDRWRSSLVDRDRSINKVSENFDELFYELFKNDVSYDIAEDLSKEAIAAHLPNLSMAKYIYKRQAVRDQPFEEFFTGWKELIADKGKRSFYTMYPIPDEKQEEETYGNMSKQEYVRQRRYAAQFPELDLDKIRNMYKDIEDEADVDFDLDLLDDDLNG